MLIKALGLMDFIGGLILIFGAKYMPIGILVFLGGIFFLKSLIGMLKDFGSWFDFLAGVMFVLSIFFTIPSWLCVIAGILVLQKGIFSFLG